MLSWYSLVSAQMANNLIKWWRTKFFNGYKQFSVVPSEFGGENCRPSDTEELLGHNPSSCSSTKLDFNTTILPTCSTPPLCNSIYLADTTNTTTYQTPTGPALPLHPNPMHPQTQRPHIEQDQHQPDQQQNPTSTDNTQINLEEFSCDVSMEGGIFRDGQERQEFSFTLYDFDGHGKITKDDIAGLVTTIYETLGSSVKVPHYGSKTIKVKLTVSPDQRKRMSATVIDHLKSPVTTQEEPITKSDPAPEDQNNLHNKKRNLNITIKDNQRHRHHCKRREQQELQQQRRNEYQHVCCTSFPCKETVSSQNTTGDLSEEDFSDHCSRISEDELNEDEKECSEDQVLSKQTTWEGIRTKRYQKCINSPRRYPHNSAQNIHHHVPLSPVLCTKARRNYKKRSSSLQRKELLEIIQANMDKNNHSFQNPSRNQCPSHINIEIDQAPLIERKHRYKHKISREPSTAQLQCLANIVNGTDKNCYLDLATLQGAAQLSTDDPTGVKNMPYCRYDKLFGAVVSMSNQQINSNLLPQHTEQQTQQLKQQLLCRNRRHYRSRSHDLTSTQMPFRYHLLEQNTNNTKCNNSRTADNLNPKSVKKSQTRLKSYEEAFEPLPTAAFKKNIKKFPQVVLGHSSSPHHLKHRNRQEDQARAMAQVVRWLEQEFSSNMNLNGSKPDCKSRKTSTKAQSSRQSPSREQVNSPSVSAVEKHEHHHVHEHIHHHYHHYQETPVVV